MFSFLILSLSTFSCWCISSLKCTLSGLSLLFIPLLSLLCLGVLIFIPHSQMLQRGGELLWLLVCHCIVTHIRNMQTRWYTIGSADYLSSLCTLLWVHFCVHSSFGCDSCIVSLSSFSCYILMTSWFLAMYCSTVPVLLLTHDFSNHLQCVCVHIVLVACLLSVKFWVVCLSLEPSSVQSSFPVPSS